MRTALIGLIIALAASAKTSREWNTQGAQAYLAGHLQEAERAFRSALALAEDETKTTDRAAILLNLAAVLRSEGKFEEAGRDYGESLRLRTLLFGAGHPSLAAPLSGLALVALAQGDLDRAEESANGSLKAAEASASSRADRTAAYQTLSQIAIARLRFPEAEKLAHDGLQTAEPESIAWAEILSTLAMIARNRGESAQAEEYGKNAAAIFEERVGPSHPWTAAAWNNLAQAKIANGRVREGRELLERTIRCWEATLGPRHPNVASALVNLGYLELGAKHARKAQGLFGRAAAIDSAAFGEASVKVALDKNHIACALLDRGRFRAAAALLRVSLATIEQAHGPEHVDSGLVSGNLAIAYAGTKQWTEANPLFRKAIRLREAAAPANDGRLGTLLEGYAATLRSLENYSEAARVDARATGIRVHNSFRN